MTNFGGPVFLCSCRGVVPPNFLFFFSVKDGFQRCWEKTRKLEKKCYRIPLSAEEITSFSYPFLFLVPPFLMVVFGSRLCMEFCEFPLFPVHPVPWRFVYFGAHPTVFSKPTGLSPRFSPLRSSSLLSLFPVAPESS